MRRESAKESIKQLTEELEKLSSNENFELPEELLSERWTEHNWKEEMEKHPLFMTELKAETQLSPMVEALRQLKYDKEFNSKEELVNSYREDRNENFGQKKYFLCD